MKLLAPTKLGLNCYVSGAPARKDAEGDAVYFRYTGWAKHNQLSRQSTRLMVGRAPDAVSWGVYEETRVNRLIRTGLADPI